MNYLFRLNHIYLYTYIFNIQQAKLIDNDNIYRFNNLILFYYFIILLFYYFIYIFNIQQAKLIDNDNIYILQFNFIYNLYFQYTTS